MTTDDLLLTVQQAADVVRVSRRTIYNWLAHGLPHQRAEDGTVRIVASALWTPRTPDPVRV